MTAAAPLADAAARAALGAELAPEHPSAESVGHALREGDRDEAIAAVATALRADLDPDAYLGLPLDLGDNRVTLPGESLTQAADRVLGGTRLAAGVRERHDGDPDWLRVDDPAFLEPTYLRNRHREWPLLAEAHRRSGEPRYAQRLLAELRHWLATVPPPAEDAPGDATLAWRSIDAGIRAGEAWPWALHALLDAGALPDEDLVAWALAYREHGRRLRRAHRWGNWLILEMQGLLHAGLLFPLFAESASWERYALATLARETGVQLHPDGLHAELSTHTHQIFVGRVERVLQVLARYRREAPPALPAALARAHLANVRLARPDGRLPNLGNGGWHDLRTLAAPGAARFPHLPELAWAASGGAEGRPPEPASFAFPYAGYAVFRTGHEPGAVWTLFDGGPFGLRHQHEDALNVLLHAYGRTMIPDAGKPRFDGSWIDRFARSTFAHATVCVDGEGQARRVGFDPAAVDAQQPAPLHARTGTRVDAADAVYDGGYGPEAERRATHQRRVFLLKALPPLPPCVLVVDRLRARDGREHRFEAQWPLAFEDATAEGAHATARAEPDAPRPHLFASADTDLTIVRGQREPVPRGWRFRENEPDGDLVPCPVIVASWRGVDTRRAFLLLPVPDGREPPVARVDADPDPADLRVAVTTVDGTRLDLHERDLLEGL